jgi:hypothetical protein
LALGLQIGLLIGNRGDVLASHFFNGVPMALRPTQGDEEIWWRELQLAASASAGGRAANFGLFFNGAIPSPENLPSI